MTRTNPTVPQCLRRRLAVVPILLLLLLPSALPARQVDPSEADTGPSEIKGRVMDQATGQGVQDATVVLEGPDTTFMAVTDTRGLFGFGGVNPGEYRVMVRHLAYGEHFRPVSVDPASVVALRVLISQEAIELDPLLVEVMSQRERRNRSRGTMIQEVTRPEIERAARTSHHLGDLLRQTVPGLRVYDSNFSPGGRTCIEFRGRRSIHFANRCQSPILLLDGVRIYDPPAIYNTIQPHTIQRMEVVPPAEAGLLYGSESAFGVLVIETRVWLAPEEREILPDHLRGGTYDWSLEGRDHSWKRVFATSLAANALGVWAGLSLADRCVRFDDLSTDLFASDCDGWETAGSWVAAIGIPLVGSALAARYSGATSLSQGRFVPALISGAIALLPGYAMGASAQDDASSSTFRAGQVMVLVGIPFAVTVADRIFRQLRGR